MSAYPFPVPLAWLPADVRRPGEATRSPPRDRGGPQALGGVRELEREAANAAMERYARGEDDAFSDLYDALAPRLRGYLVRASRDPACADDLLQQTMLQIHRARGRFIAGADVLPWAFAIARRLAIDAMRRERPDRRAISLQTGGPEAGPVEVAAEQHRADELVDSGRLARALERELARLPEPHRAAFDLVKNQGLSVREAAAVLGATPMAVKLRAHRAYAALRAALAHLVDPG